MLEIILSSVGLGIMLSLVFIGPVFFLLIETSFSRGIRHALALDLGVIFADLLCITAAYFCSGDLVLLIDKHPEFYRITAFIIFIYGIYMMLSQTKMSIENEKKLINQDYWKTFLNGLFLNLLNIGVVLFWLVTVISVRNKYPEFHQFIVYILFMIGTYLAIDFLKIFLAKQFHHKLTPKIAMKIRKVVGGILVLCSVLIFLQSFKKFNQLDRRLEKEGINKEQLIHHQ